MKSYFLLLVGFMALYLVDQAHGGDVTTLGSDGLWYSLHFSAKNWYDASGICQSEGGCLAMDKTSTSHRFLTQWLSGWTYWLGIHDQSREGSFRYVDGSTVYSGRGHWGSGEPNNAGGEDCVEMRTTGWNDAPCSLKKSFVCQRNPIPKGPRGHTGPQGPRGWTGSTGSRGPQGPQGPRGSTGSTGSTGPRGYQGYNGQQGANGGKGATGPRGAQGLVGSQGPKGAKGDKGDKGEKGVAGKLAHRLCVDGTFKSKDANETESGFAYLKHIHFGRTFARKPNLFTSIMGLERDLDSSSNSFMIKVEKLWPFGADVSLTGIGLGVKSIAVYWMACL